jgi:hypothetical protein
MKLSTVLRMGTMWLTIFGMALPTTVIGANPASVAARSVIDDVSLGPDGTLRGTIVGANGYQSPNTPIQFHREGQLVARTVTDTHGHFVARNLTGGVYAVQTPGNVDHYRVWTNQAAPPSALNALNIRGGEIVRGQYEDLPPVDGTCYDCAPGPGPGPGRHGFMANPWLIGLGVAAAIAIPLALDDSNRRRAS